MLHGDLLSDGMRNLSNGMLRGDLLLPCVVFLVDFMHCRVWRDFHLCIGSRDAIESIDLVLLLSFLF